MKCPKCKLDSGLEWDVICPTAFGGCGYKRNFLEYLFYGNMFMFLLRPICLAKTIWRTLPTFPFFMNGEFVSISGHDYVEQKSGILMCKVCGDIIN